MIDGWMDVAVCVCRQYQWIDERGKKCKCTAPQYVDYVMSYSQKCISDEAVFPTKYGKRSCIFHACILQNISTAATILC